jgi:hypothetical protein
MNRANHFFGLSLKWALGLAIALGTNAVEAQVPSWWVSRQVITNPVPNDFALVNQGQAKWMVTNAYLEFAHYLPGAGNSNILNLVSNFSQNGNYQILNVGQLKNLAKPFYERIQEAAVSNPNVTNALPFGVGMYPWTTVTNDDSNYSPVNIGQLKHVFSFDLSVLNTSLASHVTNQLLSRMIGAASSSRTLLKYWSSYYYGMTPHSPAPFPTNAAFPDGISTNCWLRSVSGWSAITHWQANHSMFTAISPWHAVTASHALNTNAGPERMLIWCGTNGLFITNHFIDCRYVGKPVYLGGIETPDYGVVLLSNALPAEVVPVSISDTNFNPAGLHMIQTGHNAGTNIWAMLSKVTGRWDGWLGHSSPAWSNSWYEPYLGWGYSGGVLYDSGLPNFFVISNQLVYIGPHSTPASVNFPAPSLVQATCDELSTAHSKPQQSIKVQMYGGFSQ